MEEYYNHYNTARNKSTTYNRPVEKKSITKKVGKRKLKKICVTAGMMVTLIAASIAIPKVDATIKDNHNIENATNIITTVTEENLKDLGAYDENFSGDEVFNPNKLIEYSDYFKNTSPLQFYGYYKFSPYDEVFGKFVEAAGYENIDGFLKDIGCSSMEEFSDKYQKESVSLFLSGDLKESLQNANNSKGK